MKKRLERPMAAVSPRSSGLGCLEVSVHDDKVWIHLEKGTERAELSREHLCLSPFPQGSRSHLGGCGRLGLLTLPVPLQGPALGQFRFGDASSGSLVTWGLWSFTKEEEALGTSQSPVESSPVREEVEEKSVWLFLFPSGSHLCL